MHLGRDARAAQTEARRVLARTERLRACLPRDPSDEERREGTALPFTAAPFQSCVPRMVTSSPSSTLMKSNETRNEQPSARRTHSQRSAEY